MSKGRSDYDAKRKFASQMRILNNKTIEIYNQIGVQGDPKRSRISNLLANRIDTFAGDKGVVSRAILLAIRNKKDFPKEEIINGAMYCLSGLLADFGLPEVVFSIEDGELKTLKLGISKDEMRKAQQALGVDPKASDEAFDNLEKGLIALKDLLNSDMNDVKEYNKLKDAFSTKKFLASYMADICMGILVVLGAAAALMSLYVIVLSCFAPASLVALTTSLGVSSAATLTIGGVSLSLTETAAATAAVGTIVAVVGDKISMKLKENDLRSVGMSDAKDVQYDEFVVPRMQQILMDRMLNMASVIVSADKSIQKIDKGLER